MSALTSLEFRDSLPLTTSLPPALHRLHLHYSRKNIPHLLAQSKFEYNCATVLLHWLHWLLSVVCLRRLHWLHLLSVLSGVPACLPPWLAGTTLRELEIEGPSDAPLDLRPMQHLTYLRIQNALGKVDHLPPSLERLEIGPNQDRVDSMLSSLHGLTSLSVDYVPRAEVLARLRDLTLVVDDYSVPAMPAALSGLTSLHLRFHYIPLPDGLSALTGLRRLKFTAFPSIPSPVRLDFLDSLHHLTEIDFESRSQLELPANLSALANLQKVSLRLKHSISLDPLTACSSLTYLRFRMKYNQAAMLPVGLAALSSLRWLDISSCDFSFSQLGPISKLQQLEHLNAASTSITHLPVGLLASLTNLRHLNLHLNDNFCDLGMGSRATSSYNSSLTHLCLSSNRNLDRELLPLGIERLVGLRTLDLTGNYALPASRLTILRSLEHLAEVDVRGCPAAASSSLWLRQRMAPLRHAYTPLTF